MTAFHRDLIVALADRHKLPAVYYDRSSVTEGGLISFGPDFVDQYRQAASYVDRILKGAKPADLPVQAPGRQPKNREGSRHRRARHSARSRRRDHRVGLASTHAWICCTCSGLLLAQAV